MSGFADTAGELMSGLVAGAERIRATKAVLFA
jgi:hypothetical protein